MVERTYRTEAQQVAYEQGRVDERADQAAKRIAARREAETASPDARSLAAASRSREVLDEREAIARMIVAKSEQFHGRVTWTGAVLLKLAADVRSRLPPASSVKAPGIWPNIIAPQMYENPAEGWDDPRLPPFDLIWKTARAKGYAVGLHGSMRRDCDLIAVAWVNEAASAEELIAALCDGLNARQVGIVERKPHGRLATTLAVDGWVKPIDLSVLPASSVIATEEEDVKGLVERLERRASVNRRVETLLEDTAGAIHHGNHATLDEEAAQALTSLASENSQLREALRDVLPYANAGLPPVRVGEMTVTEKASRLLGGKCVDCGGLPDDHQSNYYCPEFRAVARSLPRESE